MNSGLGFRIFEVLGFTSRGGLESFAGYPQMRDCMWQGLPKGKLDPWETPCGLSNFRLTLRMQAVAWRVNLGTIVGVYLVVSQNRGKPNIDPNIL